MSLTVVFKCKSTTLTLPVFSALWQFGSIIIMFKSFCQVDLPLSQMGWQWFYVVIFLLPLFSLFPLGRLRVQLKKKTPQSYLSGKNKKKKKQQLIYRWCSCAKQAWKTDEPFLLRLFYANVSMYADVSQTRTNKVHKWSNNRQRGTWSAVCRWVGDVQKQHAVTLNAAIRLRNALFILTRQCMQSECRVSSPSSATEPVLDASPSLSFTDAQHVRAEQRAPNAEVNWGQLLGVNTAK